MGEQCPEVDWAGALLLCWTLTHVKGDLVWLTGEKTTCNNSSSLLTKGQLEYLIRIGQEGTFGPCCTPWPLFLEPWAVLARSRPGVTNRLLWTGGWLSFEIFQQQLPKLLLRLMMTIDGKVRSSCHIHNNSNWVQKSALIMSWDSSKGWKKP